METIYEKYMALPIDKGLLCLEYGDIAEPYFCYPVNANPIGIEGCILYCFLTEYGEMVFACNPESCVDQNVYPLAANFEDFIRLILACGTANPLEQIVWMDKNKFEEHMANEEKILTDEQRTAAQQLQRALSLLPIENPFEYVKSIQKDFDGSKIQYSDEYYEVTGILQLLLYCLLFTAMVKIAVIGGAVNGLYFYPKEVQDRAIELGLIDRNTMNRKRKCFMIPFFIVMLAALVLIIGLWNGASSFGEAYWQALLFLEVMNIYDGVVIDKLWVGHSQFWVLPGLEDASFVQTWRQVLKKRSILALIWVAGAAIVGGIVHLIF